MRIVLLSEGNSDVAIGDACTRGAIAILLRRVITEFKRIDPDAVILHGDRLPRLNRGSGFDRKVRMAIEKYDGKADALAIVIDRDGPENAVRLELLRAGRDGSARSFARKTVVGVAVEMMEAWLLADSRALATVLSTAGAQPDPETVRDPKSELTRLARLVDKRPGDCIDEIARKADLQRVCDRCRSFEEFVKEVKHRLVERG